MNPIHNRIVEGDGSAGAPFVFHTSNQSLSAGIQREIIGKVVGGGDWQIQESRRYPSPRGEPGNQDLCEHVVAVEGAHRSIWFDLYLVTRLVNSPELNKMKREFAQSPQAEDMLRRAMNPNQKRGCLGMVLLLAAAAVAATALSRL